MKNINDLSNKKRSKKDIDNALMKSFMTSMEKSDFKKLVLRLNIHESILKKYTSKLENTASELNNCNNCKGLYECKNSITGHVSYPSEFEDTLEFSYVPCKYEKEKIKKENKNKVVFFETPEFLRNATLSEMYQEKERKEVTGYIKEFLKAKKNNESIKGVFLHGSFGSGKSYIISALLNELSNKGYKTVNVYYPLLLNKLKNSFSENTFGDIMDEIMNADLLLLDDIGAENNTSWSRDEVLGVIIQFRMDNNLTTFITSNFNMEELENHLKTTNKSFDEIKARRIVERIKTLTKDIELIGENKREKAIVSTIFR